MPGAFFPQELRQTRIEARQAGGLENLVVSKGLPPALVSDGVNSMRFLATSVAVLSALAVTSFAASPLEDKDRPVSQEPGLTPEQTAAKLKVPAGFKVQVVASEPDVIQPIAMTLDDRGRLWVVTNTNYPKCPGEKKDSILIFEDADGDGRAEKRTVFYDKLTFSSGIAVGHGGVWVGAPPNLYFFADKNGDDKPDAEPEIVLDGWGNEDTHETLNDFTWGPDGWLYGTHGVFTNSKVGKPRHTEG